MNLLTTVPLTHALVTDGKINFRLLNKLHYYIRYFQAREKWSSGFIIKLILEIIISLHLWAFWHWGKWWEIDEKEDLCTLLCLSFSPGFLLVNSAFMRQRKLNGFFFFFLYLPPKLSTFCLYSRACLPTRVPAEFKSLTNNYSVTTEMVNL